MTSEVQRAVMLDTLGTLEEIARESLPPAEARRRLGSVRARFPALRIDLVWEEQAFDNTVHYDALIRAPDCGTIALSYCPDRAVPWPLRGLQRPGDQYLLRVGQTLMRVDQAMACIDFVWSQANVLERLIDVCLMQQALDEEPVELSDRALQHAMDAFRRSQRLYSASETRAWLRARGMTPLQLEEKVRDHAVIQCLQDRLAAGLIAPYFDEHRSDFDRVRVACLSVHDGNDVLDRVRGGEIAFSDAVGATTNDAQIKACTWFRRTAPAEIAEAVFGAVVGDVIGPAELDGNPSLVRVMSFEAARLDATTAGAIRDLLVRDWLTRRRAEVEVEWYWGNDRFQAEPLT